MPSNPPRPNEATRLSTGGSSSSQNQHRPTHPSGLRQAHMPPSSPEDRRNNNDANTPAQFTDNGIQPIIEGASIQTEPTAMNTEGAIEEPEVNARTALLGEAQKYSIPTHENCGEENCNHGAMSPRPRHMRGYGSFAPSITSTDGYGGSYTERVGGSGDSIHGVLGHALADSLIPRDGGDMSSAQFLEQRKKAKHSKLMYLLYYLPSTNWIRQYRWSFVQGDLIAALTMASFYIPMSLSYASNLAHIPPINGLYAFVFNPLIYALLGTCPQMVVGPEAAGSLLTGQVVREAINSGHHPDKAGRKNAQVAGMVTGLAGAIILAAGLCRLGFLDSVLSRPFLRGFISAIGVVIFVDQLIPEMGLDTAAAHSASGAHGSSLDKIMFLFRHASEANKITCAVAFGAFAIVMVLREIKKRLQPRTPWVAYIPDRFIVVVLSAVFTWNFDWHKQGLDILGNIKAKGAPFQAHFPFDSENFHHVNDAFSTSFLIALLGFFESSVAAKSLGTSTGKTKKVVKADGRVEEEPEGITNVTVSANRELVALGVANMLGGLFMSIPAFGGYGRSKVNASTGGKTPMSSVFLSLITVFCVLFLLPYFYYIPKAVLSAMISVVAYSLIEEAPHDIHFFWTISGYSELLLMTLIFLTTFFWNLRIGIAVGIGLSLLRLLRHSTRPRIQILGRVPGTQDFENAETDPDALEFASHCLIVKIPEPLTFANTGSLKDRLRRLEDHNSTAAHPAQPKKRKPEQYNRHLIFDIHGVTALDPAACQVLLEIVESYIERGTRVYFSRIPSRRSEVWRLMVVSGIVEVCGGEKFFLRSVGEALKMSEREETLSLWAESARGSPEGSVLSGSAAAVGAGGGGGIRRSGTIEREGEDGSTTAAAGEAVAVEGTR